MDNIKLKKEIDKILSPFVKFFKGEITTLSIKDICDSYYIPNVKICIEELQAGHYEFNSFASCLLKELLKLGNNWVLISYNVSINSNNVVDVYIEFTLRWNDEIDYKKLFKK